MHFAASTHVDCTGSASRSAGSGYSTINRATPGSFTTADHFATTTGAATTSARDSSAADSACGCSNPTGSQHVRAGSRSPWKSYPKTWLVRTFNKALTTPSRRIGILKIPQDANNRRTEHKAYAATQHFPC
uniref:Uncharacterized protein n=1 Tax=Romanomermis culicivorax TaxID=13658 RepID=A0A915L4N2_ROMCU